MATDMTSEASHIVNSNYATNSKIKWWQNTVFYEIYIASFQDSNNDGIGDFNGITSRLDYLQNLGITGLWITPFYPSPKIDNGYDITDYYDVDADFGCLADFDHFISEAHKRNIKVIIDVVVNHVSTDHRWFKEAIANADSKYRDYFIFKDKINNWQSFFGGSAWQKEPHGEQYYYHKFAVEQVDLNWQNPAVKNEIINMLTFWLDRGVDGFRLDVINFLSCDDIDTESTTFDNLVDNKGLQIHQYDIDQPSIQSCLADLCNQIRNYSQSLGKECFLVGEIGHDELAKLHPYQSKDLLDVVFNFNLGSLPKFDIKTIYQQLVEMDKQQTGLPTIFFNSHDMPRAMSRLCHNNVEEAKALATLTLMLKGVCFLYFGEEIGMPNFAAKKFADLRDINATNHFQLALEQGKTQEQAFEKAMAECRDKSRLYMQWSTKKYSGFSGSEPWIGTSTLSNMPNVEQQKNDPKSLWHWYQQLISLRSNSQTLSNNDDQKIFLNDNVLLILRCLDQGVTHILINFNVTTKPIHFKSCHEILASSGFDSNKPDWLLPYGVLITREISCL
ncbi:MAG: glucohydrolase [Gammaproteobacteria bacterium]|nr:MAG: glucohydrolase [Gammaproteobacteria bacterium]